MDLARSLDLYEREIFRLHLPRATAHVVLGSGYGQALDALPGFETVAEWTFEQLALPRAGVSDHVGRLRVLKHTSSGKLVQFQMGRLHGYEGHSPQKVVSPLLLAREIGIANFVLTNAAGGMDPSLPPGSAMIIQDHMNLTGQNPLVGPNPMRARGGQWGPRFPDMSETYHGPWQEILASRLAAEGVSVGRGAYLGVLGPSFETPMEVRTFAKWGFGAVGMSTVWEAITLRHTGARLAGVSLISNFAAGMSSEPLEHEKIVATCRQSAEKIVNGVARFVVEDLT